MKTIYKYSETTNRTLILHHRLFSSKAKVKAYFLKQTKMNTDPLAEQKIYREPHMWSITIANVIHEWCIEFLF